MWGAFFVVLLEFCEDETFEGDCGSDSVIMVEQARYGRMRIGTCLTTNYGFAIIHLALFVSVKALTSHMYAYVPL